MNSAPKDFSPDAPADLFKGLYLDIYAPLKPTGAQKDRKYPVMFFIYGGGAQPHVKTPITKCLLRFSNRVHHGQICGICIGYYFGGANDEQIDGASTVRFLRDVIIVVPNWRSVHQFQALQGRGPLMNLLFAVL